MKSLLRKRLGSTAIILVVALALWGYIVGPMLATFQQSITGKGGGLAQYGAHGESMLGSLMISFLSVITSQSF
jgi:hypothetical protein